PQVDAERASKRVRHRDIGITITIEVADDWRLRTVVGSQVPGTGKGAIAVADENSHGVTFETRDCDIGDTVMVKVPNCLPEVEVRDSRVDRLTKRAVTLAKVNLDRPPRIAG